MKYKSELIKDIVDTRGHEKSSLHYESECVESWIEETKGAYPKLCDYESEWLNYINENPIGEFPYMTLTDVTQATVNNVVPYAYKSAILKGNTKYRDIDTGDILDTFDETKNLELVSVKMPVLTTTGKNLFDANKMVFIDDTMYGYCKFKDNDSINCTLSISIKDTSIPTDLKGFYLGLTGNGANPQNGYKWLISDGTIQSLELMAITSNYNYISIYPKTNGAINKLTSYFNIQLEYGTVKTTYEPYKTNILTVDEDVELRGIGDVKDELNLLTGELTQRIGEIVLDGSESWRINDEGSPNTISFICQSYGGMQDNTSYNLMISDRFKSGIKTEDSEIIDNVTSNFCYIRILRKNLETEDVAGFKSWLQSNPVTVQYKLATELVKTVDLTITNQDGETLNKLKPIEGTIHITTSGTPINPTVSLEIPVEAITQNLNSFIEEE